MIKSLRKLLSRIEMNNIYPLARHIVLTIVMIVTVMPFSLLADEKDKPDEKAKNLHYR